MVEESGQPEALKERLALYEMAIELRNAGSSYSEVRRRPVVSKATIGLWVRGAKPRRVPGAKPDLSPSSDLAYVAGFYPGDGKGAGHEHKVRFELADREQLEHVSGLVAKILGRGPKPFTRDCLFYVVYYDSVVLSDYLTQPIDALAEHLKDFNCEFLQGFFDAEGYASCGVDVKARRVNNFVMGDANTNLEYLHFFNSLLGKFGLFGRMRMTNRRGQKMTIRGKTWIRRNDVYHLVLDSMSQVRKFRDLVNFRNTTKNGMLDDLVRMTQIKASSRYAWFTSRYRNEGRKWVGIVQKG